MSARGSLLAGSAPSGVTITSTSTSTITITVTIASTNASTSTITITTHHYYFYYYYYYSPYYYYYYYYYFYYYISIRPPHGPGAPGRRGETKHIYNVRQNLRQLCRLTVLCKSCGLWPVWVKLLVRSGAGWFC